MLTEFCQESVLLIANTLFQQHKRWLYTWTWLDGDEIILKILKSDWLCSFQAKLRSSIQSAKTRLGADYGSDQFSSVQSLSRVWLFATPWTAEHQASLSITNSWSSLRLTSIKSVMPSSHLILHRPLLLLPPIPPSIPAIKKNEKMPFEATWMNLETAILSEISQTEKENYHTISLICGIQKEIQINL